MIKQQIYKGAWEITKWFEVAVAHFLPNHLGKCRNIHGHTLKIGVTVLGGKLNEQEMIIDFGEVKSLMDRYIVALDHKLLNDLIPVPTVEILSAWLYEELEPTLVGKGLYLKSITVKESDTSEVKFYK